MGVSKNSNWHEPYQWYRTDKYGKPGPIFHEHEYLSMMDYYKRC